MTSGSVGVRLVVMALAVALTGCSSSDAGAAGDLSSASSDAAPVGATADSGDALTVKTSVFAVTYRLDGAVVSSSLVGLDVPAGTVLEPTVETGAVVTKGQRLGTLKLAPRATEGSEAGTVVRSQRRLVETRLRPLTAPTSGVATLSPASARITHPGLDVVVPLKPLQELRYRGMDFAGAATVETVLGQRSSPCVAVWIEQEAREQAAADSGDIAVSAVHCRLAADVETAAGLPAVLTLSSRPLADVLAVPLIFIGLDKTGENYVVRVGRGDSIEERPVVVGSTDGVRRVVTSGLSPGDVITPVAAS